ncbi:GlxA family transcriptional regulator [Mesorhizobium tamadayense]|uniref:GlxA family transcriptional regulator n=1 Tax=Mesorhizobium tamadayense TaxID=425306 RepID=A0A3P3FVN6_9HYPH|nr:GlxA family transcriptional regulator [Mesorhizobium tamadayense]RRI01779.1 GlxA family transcriptional regulator [Mesorhizobium tamadayense]
MNAPFSPNAMTAFAHADDPAEAGQLLHIAVLALPGFSHLALHAYIEPLRIANALAKEPLFRWQVVGMDSQAVIGANGLSISVDATIEALNALGSERAGPNQLVIVAGEPVDRQSTPDLNGFLRTIARRGVAISAIGTATWLLAQAGLLADSRCTIHWSRLAAFSEVFRKPRIRDSLFVKDGQYSTCAGELAAFDLAVDLVATHAGAFIAQEVCRHATVAGQRSGSNRQTGPSGIAFTGVSESLIAAIRIMEENIEFPISMIELSGRVGVSRRQLERLFATCLGVPPAKHYLQLRIDHAKRLIEGTRLPMVDIAFASGFVSASHFSKCFRAIHRISPQQLRLTVPAWVGRGIG